MARAVLRFAAMDLPISRPFRISRGEKSVATNVLIEVEAEGVVGRGEAAPNPRYGQSQATALGALETFDLPPRAELFDLPPILDAFRAHAPGESAAHAGLQSALWDWTGRRLGRSVRDLFGIRGSAVPPSSWTISIDSPDQVVDRVHEARDWPLYKVKLGGGEADEAAIRALREATSRPFRVDANEAWSEVEAREKIDWLATLGCELVEQPLPAADLDAMARLRERSPLPLIADEAACGKASLAELARAYHGLNVKLMKTGGLKEAIRLVHDARRSGMEVMLGCFVESGLGIAAAATLLPLARWADLDGAALLRQDPFEGCTIRGGEAQLSGAPGLGVHPRRSLDLGPSPN